MDQERSRHLKKWNYENDENNKTLMCRILESSSFSAEHFVGWTCDSILWVCFVFVFFVEIAEFVDSDKAESVQFGDCYLSSL